MTPPEVYRDGSLESRVGPNSEIMRMPSEPHPPQQRVQGCTTESHQDSVELRSRSPHGDFRNGRRAWWAVPIFNSLKRTSVK